MQEKGKAAGGVQTRIVAFDFSQDLSLEAYAKLAAKFSDLDIAVLVNNVGQASQIDRSVDTSLSEVTVNTYPIVLLTQQIASKMVAKFSSKKQRSLIINLSSIASYGPCP